MSPAIRLFDRCLLARNSLKRRRTVISSRFFSCVVGLLAVIALAPSASAVSYSFSNIADTTTNGFTSFAGPSLNINGNLAFVGNTATHKGVYIGNGGGLTLLTRSDTSVYATYGGPSMNNDGRVSFHANRDGFLSDAIVIYSSTGLTELATGTITGSTPGAFAAFDSTMTSISSGGTSGGQVAGRVVFMAQTQDTNPRVGLHRGVNMIVVDSTAGNGSFSNYGSWQITGAGTTVFTATKNGVAGVFTATQGLGSVGTIAAVGGGGSFTGFTTASINAGGKVAFGASVTGANNIYLKTPSSSPTIFATNTGSYASFSGPVINNVGSIAFYATLDNGTFGIYSGPNPVTDKIIEKGASLFGSTVTGLSAPSFNDNGQLAFQVTLANGNVALVRASPVVAPVSLHSTNIGLSDTPGSAGFSIATTSGKAEVVADPLNASNGVIDMVDYPGGGGININKTMTVGSNFRVQFNYRFVSVGVVSVTLGNQTLMTINAPASGPGRDTFASVDQTFNLAAFGLSPGDLSSAFVLSGSGAQLHLDNIALNVPEPSTLWLLCSVAFLRGRVLQTRARLPARQCARPC
jgi:hypothetical protein